MPSSVPAPRGVCKGFLFFYYEYQTRRNLVWGIPDVPEIPNVPGFPEIPEVPEYPEYPEPPEHPEAEHKKGAVYASLPHEPKHSLT